MKRIISFLLALVLMLPMLPAPAKAATASGYCGYSAVWSYDDATRTLTISVEDGYDSSSVYNYYNDNQPWKAYRGRIQKVVIEEGIYEIGVSAFEEHPVLTTVSLPNTLETISYLAFSGCTKLKTINLPESLTFIDFYAFSDCKNLTAVVIPSGITTISDGLFSRCTRLSSVKLHNGITEIGDYAFNYCKALKSITLPNKLTCINDSTFYSSGLTSIVIPEGVTIIEKYAFAYCDSLKKVTLPDTIDVIDENAFQRYERKITDVYYGGTKAQKQAMVINKGNANLKNATWHYNSMPAPVVTAESGGSGNYWPVLSWNAVKGADEYQVYRATKKDGTYKLRTTTSSTSWTDYDCAYGIKYYYKVRAVNDAAKSAFSGIVIRRVRLDSAYISVTTAAVTGCPKITWEKVTGANRYKIFRSSSADGSYTQIGETTKLNYTDKTAEVGQRWYYKVQACSVDSYADAPMSGRAYVTCVLPRPVVKISLNKNKPKLRWEFDNRVGYYEVYRAGTKNGNYQLIDSVYDTSYVDTSAKKGKTYYYKVIAVHNRNTSWNSAFSAVKSIKTK